MKARVRIGGESILSDEQRFNINIWSWLWLAIRVMNMRWTLSITGKWFTVMLVKGELLNDLVWGISKLSLKLHLI